MPGDIADLLGPAPFLDPIPPKVTITLPRDPSMADTLHDRVMSAIAEFEKSLAPEEELGGMFASFNGNAIHIDDIGYHNPSLIIFYGHMDSGTRMTVLQHMSQLNMALVAVKAEHQPARRVIGFKSDPKTENTEASSETEG
jgi:hypothetical protein